MKVLHEKGLDSVRYALWDATGWHRDAVLDAVNTASGEIAGYDAGLQGGPERER